MTNQTPLSILIVEDEPIIAADLSSFLSTKGHQIIGVAHNGIDALDMIHSRKPSFIILDINLGSGISGIDVAEVIHTKYRIPYIFLSSYDDDNTLAEAQQHAPYGYLVKPFQERSILTTIRMAMANYKRSVNDQIVDRKDIDMKAVTPTTDQEFTITQKLIEGKPYKLIADELCISVNTIKYHVKNIYLKMDVNGRSELLALFI